MFRTYFLKTFSRGVFLILFRIGIYLCNNKQRIDKTKMIMISLKKNFLYMLSAFIGMGSFLHKVLQNGRH